MFVEYNRLDRQTDGHSPFFSHATKYRKRSHLIEGVLCPSVKWLLLFRG